MTELEKIQKECNELELIIAVLEEELEELEYEFELYVYDEDIDYGEDVDIEGEYNEDMRELMAKIECYKDELQLLSDMLEIMAED